MNIHDDIPLYEKATPAMLEVRSKLASNFARLIIDTTLPYLPCSPSELKVLDVGSGYGHTSIELARNCRQVVGIEPSKSLYEYSVSLLSNNNIENLILKNQGIDNFSANKEFDLIVLDNVFEHLPNQAHALKILSRALKPGGVLYLLMPNKLWPIEAHYNLPFLSYLPLPLANIYLKISKRGTDYTDASYAPTYFKLNRLLRSHPEFSFKYVLPSNVTLATKGNSLLYRLGISMIKRFPILWVISKALLVVAIKKSSNEIS
jgi:SAM-dependent methyltransferase